MGGMVSSKKVDIFTEIEKWLQKERARRKNKCERNDVWGEKV